MKHIKPADFDFDMHSKLASVIDDEMKSNGRADPTLLFTKINDEDLEEYAREVTFEKYAVSSNWEDRFPGITQEMIETKYAKDLVCKFLIEKLDRQIQSNHRELELTENEEKKLLLMKSNNDLEKEKKKIREKLGS